MKVKCDDVSDDNTGSLFKIEYPSIFFSEDGDSVVHRKCCVNFYQSTNRYKSKDCVPNRSNVCINLDTIFKYAAYEG
jgi:hypothetical protein